MESNEELSCDRPKHPTLHGGKFNHNLPPRHLRAGANARAPPRRARGPAAHGSALDFIPISPYEPKFQKRTSKRVEKKGGTYKVTSSKPVNATRGHWTLHDTAAHLAATPRRGLRLGCVLLCTQAARRLVSGPTASRCDPLRRWQSTCRRRRRRRT